ncbi:SLBB domain-containing protein [Rubrivirga sp. IMCC43871]|uniref:SLBB domain-containing protein n=1 Tax=Rubrivirga sp. IMCC43871 TaxID=3391575 RepID=UPI00398FC9D5
MTRTLIAALSLVLAAPLGAQTYSAVDDVQASAPGYFTFARPGERVVTVTAVGALGATGRYAVGEGATVVDLLALAGGATPERAATAVVRVYREGGRVVEARAQDLYRDGAAPVVLREGDVVEVVGLTSTAPGYYVHSSPDAEPIVATAAGAVTAPGRFAVDPGTTVADLLALAGGTRGGELDTAVETTTTVRLYRAGNVAFEALLSETYARPTPALQSGDVVELTVVNRRRSSFTWRDGLSIVTAAVAVVIATDRVVN